jgi:hypothetical protein
LDRLPDTDAALSAIDTVGVMMLSLAAIESVIVSPTFALLVSAALLDTIVSSINVGAVLSIVTSLESVTDVTTAPALLAMSSYTIRLQT